MFGRKRKRERAERLVAAGGRGVGTIVDVADTGVTINNDPRVKLTFRIEPLDGSAPFHGEKKVTVSRIAIPFPGLRYPVYYDREDPSEFIFVAAVDPGHGQQNLVADFGDAFGPDGSGIGATLAPRAA